MEHQVTKHQASLSYGIAERGTGPVWHQARAGIKAHLRELGMLGSKHTPSCTCGPRSASAVTCWPGCWTRTGIAGPVAGLCSR